MTRLPCSECGDRPPRFRRRGGRVQGDREHGMCAQCWKAALNRSHARRLALEQQLNDEREAA